MKGIILAGGKGTRLYPITKVISKQLLPIYDKPMIYYPISVLLHTGIKDILIISTPNDIVYYKNLLGNGERIGVNFRYMIQEKPNGLAEAFILGESFIGSDSVCLILGDNLFYGQGFITYIEKALSHKIGATIFGYPVSNPKDFGVVETDQFGKAISIEEKPSKPKSHYAVPGLYFYDNDVIEIAKTIKPSARGELEITSINNEYMTRGNLNVVQFGRGMAWLDTGTPSAMHRASAFVESVQSMQGYYIGCIEEISWRKGNISTSQLHKLGEELEISEYGKYILSLVKDK